MDISDILIDWYKVNKRELPWRDTNDPYFIWLSEVILQQTRVKQGLSYYYKFIENFPTVSDLALAKEEQVLKLWQGLGYYSRARNLHQAARFIHYDRDGVFPSEYPDILRLKGVGEYTAGAIASFAFNKAHPAIDGNVYRVLARLFNISLPIDSSEGKKRFRGIATEILDKKNPAIFNQAIMEFGAIQCTPKKPDCENCCLNRLCMGLKHNNVESLPFKAKKVKQRDRYFNYLLIHNERNLMLTKRSGNDIWKNLYEFPLIETSRQLSERQLLQHATWRSVFGQNEPLVEKISRPYRHVLSHQKINTVFWRINIKNDPFPELNDYSVIPVSELEKYPVSRLMENYIVEENLL